MHLQILIENKYLAISSAALMLVPFYTWRNLYYSYKRLRNDYKEEELFHKRHDCVVIYSGEPGGMIGWPPYKERTIYDFYSKRLIRILAILREPVLYFVDTAEKSLDIAFRMINTSYMQIALLEARRRGVEIRVLVNFEDCLTNTPDVIQSWKQEGIQCALYVSQDEEENNRIMNYRFMVKDYTKDSGFLFTSSLDLHDDAFTRNYENIVFTSNHHLVTAFHENFEECWDYVNTDNRGLTNHNILLEAGYL